MQQVWLQVAVGWSVGILSVRIGPTFYDPQIDNAKTKAARLRIIATKTHLEILKYRNKTPLINDNDHHRSDYLVHFSSILIHFLLCEAPCVKLLPNLQRLQIMWGGQFWTGPEVSAPKAR